MNQGITLNTLINKERENLSMATAMKNKATELLVEITGDFSFQEKPGLLNDKEEKRPPLMEGISQLQKQTNIQLSMLDDKLNKLYTVLFGTPEKNRD